MLLSVQPVGLHTFYVSGRHSCDNGVKTSWERIGLKEKKPSSGAKQAPQQLKREGTSSASYLETLQVINPGSRKMHFSSHTSLRRHWFIGNGELRSPNPGILERSTQGSGLEALQHGSSLWIRISSRFPFQGSLQEAHSCTDLLPSKQKDKCSGVLFPPASLICKLIITRGLEGRK